MSDHDFVFCTKYICIYKCTFNYLLEYVFWVSLKAKNAVCLCRLENSTIYKLSFIIIIKWKKKETVNKEGKKEEGEHETFSLSLSMNKKTEQELEKKEKRRKKEEKKRRRNGAWLYGVHRTCVEMVSVSHGTSHVTTRQRCMPNSLHRFGGYSKRAVTS